MGFANLVNNLDQKLPVATKTCGLESVKFYYNNMFNLNHSRLKLKIIPTISIISLLKPFDINKAYEIDNLFARFLKDGHDVLAISIT